MPFVEVPAALDRLWIRSSRPAPRFVGRPIDQARALADGGGIAQVRVVSLDGGTVVLTMDHRTTRLNLLVLDGVVERAGFF